MPVEIVPKPVVIEPAEITPALLTASAPELMLRLLPFNAPVEVTVPP